MVSFQAKIGWKLPRMNEKKKKKKIVPMSFYLTRNRKFQINSKKIQKVKQQQYDFFSSQNKRGNAEKERKKKKKNRLDEFLPASE